MIITKLLFQIVRIIYMIVGVKESWKHTKRDVYVPLANSCPCTIEL